LYVVFMPYKPQEPSYCYPEGALLWVHPQFILLHPFQGQFQVSHMLLEPNRLNHHVVNVNLHQNSKQKVED
jgi:regulatory protein YycH of two-component signal transduction system YycFG